MYVFVCSKGIYSLHLYGDSLTSLCTYRYLLLTSVNRPSQPGSVLLINQLDFVAVNVYTCLNLCTTHKKVCVRDVFAAHSKTT